MKKLTGVGFLIFLIGIGGIIVIAKNSSSLKGIPSIDLIVIGVGFFTIVGMLMMYHGIRAGMRKRGMIR